MSWFSSWIAPAIASRPDKGVGRAGRLAPPGIQLVIIGRDGLEHAHVIDGCVAVDELVTAARVHSATIDRWCHRTEKVFAR